jgi:hypothetical protein
LKSLSILTLLLFTLGGLSAQKAVIEGVIVDKETNRPLSYGTVNVLEQEAGVSADSSGYFRIEVTAGLYNLEASFTGYRSLIKHEVQVTNAKPVWIVFTLEQQEYELEGVVVEAEAFQSTSESPLSLQRFSVNEIERLPGATLDLSKFIKAMPGVSPRVSFGYNMIIRGGASGENRFYLDGIEIPTITHFTVQGTSGGPNGLLNVRMLRNAELHSGAFPASRPNALSSVLEIQQREGRKDKFGGNFTLGATDWGVLVEGPMGQKSSYMLSVRESFSQHMFKAIGLPVLPFYADAQYKQVFRFNNKNELTLTGVAAYDKYTLNLEADATESLLYNTGYIPEGKQLMYAGGAVYKHYLDNSYYTVVLSRNYFSNQAEKFLNNSYEVEDQVLNYLSEEGETKLRVEQKFFGGKAEWSYGLNMEHDQVNSENFSLYTFPDATIDTIAYAGEFQMVRYGAYGSFSQSFVDGKVNLFAGLRLDGNTLSSQMSNPLDQLSPRLALSWSFAEQWRMNSSAGIYYQLPSYVLLGYQENGEFVNQDRLKYMRSAQVGLGVEHSTRNGYRVNLEGFYKAYDQYPFLLLDSISFANANANYVTIGNQPADASSRGQAYGVEFSIRQKLRKSYFWMLSYTFVVSQFEDVNGELAPSSWDNRHFGSIAAGKTFGKNWQIGVRWSAAGGSPYTPL